MSRRRSRRLPRRAWLHLERRPAISLQKRLRGVQLRDQRWPMRARNPERAASSAGRSAPSHPRHLHSASGNSRCGAEEAALGLGLARMRCNLIAPRSRRLPRARPQIALQGRMQWPAMIAGTMGSKRSSIRNRGRAAIAWRRLQLHHAWTVENSASPSAKVASPQVGLVASAA